MLLEINPMNGMKQILHVEFKSVFNKFYLPITVKKLTSILTQIELSLGFI